MRRNREGVCVLMTGEERANQTVREDMYPK